MLLNGSGSLISSRYFDPLSAIELSIFGANQAKQLAQPAIEVLVKNLQ